MSIRHLLFASIVLAASISIAACETSSPLGLPDVPPTSTVPSGATAISAAAQKALYAAEVAYNVPANAYVTLDADGRLPPDVKAKAKPILLQAYNALKLARQAAAAGDTVGVMLQTAAVQQAVANAPAILRSQ